MKPRQIPPELQGPLPLPKAQPSSLVTPFPNPVSDTIRMAGRARPKRRHRRIMLSFVLCVMGPVSILALYLFFVAKDQFASTTAFSIRTETGGGTIDVLGGLSELSTGGSNDADVIYDYLGSQAMVRNMRARVDLTNAWVTQGDPIYSLRDSADIETLVQHWNRMVRVYYDTGAGLITVRVRAFDPAAAQSIARAVLDDVRDTVATLSAVAQSDLIAFSKADLDAAQARLRAARGTMDRFRRTHQIVDPQADFAGKMGLLNSLQAQQADALINLDLLRNSKTRAGDPRLVAAERRLDIVTELIETERTKVRTLDGASGYAEVYGSYQQILVDLEFAEKSYVAAQTAYDAAVADARRTTRFVAAHITPTLAETSQFPRKALILGLVFAGFGLGWMIVVLVYYSVRDRR